MAEPEAKGKGKYNVVVIGGGTAGLVTAAGTAGLGGRVALIEGNKMEAFQTTRLTPRVAGIFRWLYRWRRS